jgi:peptide/nickel transport system permease protein
MTVQFFAKRFLGAILSLWIVLTMTFLAIHLLPGDPAQAALTQSTAPQSLIERRREALGLDKPLSAQYVALVSRLLQGQLGTSWATGEPVEAMIADQISSTLTLACTSLALGVGMGLILGYFAAIPETGPLPSLSRVFTGILLGTPVMFSGTLLIWLFAIKLDWLPATGQGALAGLVLPTGAIGLTISGAIARTVDAGLRSSLEQPYVLAAQAKGLSRLGAVWHHVLPVGLLPLLDVTAAQFGFLLSGTVIAESLFARPGLGRLLLSAVLNQDVPVVQAVTILTCGIFITLNLGADLVHGALDPRIRLYL